MILGGKKTERSPVPQGRGNIQSSPCSIRLKSIADDCGAVAGRGWKIFFKEMRQDPKMIIRRR
jgi:hypothetical protein